MGRKGYFLYESLKDPSKDTVSKIKGEVLTGRFNEMINEITENVPKGEPSKPMFGYFPRPGKQESDRTLALQKLDNLTGVDRFGLRSSHNIERDKDHFKQETDRIFGKKRALQKYLAAITKPKLATEADENPENDDKLNTSSIIDE